MTNPESEKSSVPPQEPIKAQGEAAPAGEEVVAKRVTYVREGSEPKIVKKKTKRPAGGDERRDFFSDAMREVLSPFAGIIERKINPLLQAIEAIPTQAEKMAESGARVFDQPMMKAIGKKLSLPVKGKEVAPERYLRPPGAMKPGDFETVCSRCGKCVEACPADAIKLDANGLIGEGFPYIVADRQPCVVCDELACMNVCPTGALKLVDRWSIKIGTAKVDHQVCLRDRGENCTLCVDVCPITADEQGHAAAITISPITGKVIVRKNICVGCGLCESRCPTEPRAIIVMPFAAPVDPIVA